MVRNTNGYLYGVKAYTDNYGFRVSAESYKTEKNLANENESILIIGDSVAFGNEVIEERSLSGILKEKIKSNLIHKCISPRV